MKKYAENVVKQAQAWLGRNEKDGTHIEIIDTYNSHKPLARGYAVKYTDAWCSTFVSAVAIKLGYTDIIPTECGCEKHIELFKKIGAWIEDENRVPRAGEIIFYDWNDNGKGDNRGHADHVGIVERVSGNTITVIEGNYNRSVARRKLQVNAKNIRGYAVPKYDVRQTTKSIVDLANEVIAGKHGTGNARKKALGSLYNEVQAKVNEILASKKPKKSNEEIAKEVLQGKWGNGAERNRKLTQAGYDYRAIQNLVNKMLALR
jgi:hypothetical protein